MALQLNLPKAQASLQLCLEKAGIVTPPVVEFAFTLDVSGSFEDEHRDGLALVRLASLAGQEGRVLRPLDGAEGYSAHSRPEEAFPGAVRDGRG